MRLGLPPLRALLEDGRVLSHPFVIGELACGNLENREEILSLLEELPKAFTAAHDEVMRFIEDQRLMGTGLGYIDVQLLAAARLTGVPIWTEDRSLKAAAARLEIAFQADS